MSWRGHTLVMERSKIYSRGVVLRDPLSLRTVATPVSRAAARRYCRLNGYSWMDPVPVEQERIEMKV